MDTPETPTVDFLILADRAAVQGGKLYVLGGGVDFLRVASPQQPVALTLVAGLIVARQHSSKSLPVHVVIRSPDEKQVAQVEGSVTVESSKDLPDWLPVRTSVAIDGLWTFEQEGVYEFAVNVAQSKPRSLLVYVEFATSPTAP